MPSGITSHRRRMGVDGMHEGNFPVRCLSLIEEVGFHFLRPLHGCAPVPKQCMALRQQHEGAHMMQLRARLLPMPGRCVGSVQQFPGTFLPQWRSSGARRWRQLRLADET